MHRIPKIFGHSSDRRRNGSNFSSGSSSSRQAAKTKPRLDRLNASNNIDYDFSPSTSTSSSLYSSEESARTRSLELFGGKNSFRVGGIDGEIEIICQTLGFSGIDDFAIPDEEYEAMKVRSSSAPVVCSQTIEVISDNVGGIGIFDAISRDVVDSDIYFRYSGDSSDVISKKCGEMTRGYGDRDGSRVNVSEVSRRVGDNEVILSNSVSGGLDGFRGNGIKGVRPPLLDPLPSMLRPFIPDADTSVSRFSWKQDEEEVERRRRLMIKEDNFVVLDSCCFTTSSNDDDSSSTTTSSVSPNGRFRHTIMEWQKGQLLGCGSFGSVYEAISGGGFFFAVKEVSLLDQGEEGRQRIIQLEQEIALLSQFEHENIVQYYGTEKVDSHLYIFLELVSKGSLLSLYQRYNLRDSQVSAYTRQILHGLKYLHEKNVVHRDIKCANILVHTNGLVKLADFGLAKATKLNDVKSCKGTAFWMAPEVVRSLGYGLSADIWSLGCTVLEMLTRRFPYSHLEPVSALFWIGKGELPPIPDSLSCDAREFILQCLQVEPNLRPTATQLLDHPFLRRPLPSYSGAASPHNFGRQS